MKKTIAITILGALCLFGGQSFAATQKSINERQHDQTHRIKAGYKKGDLTKAETKALTKQQIHIAKKEHKMRKSGDGLTKKERARIANSQARANKKIYNHRHN